VLGLYELAGVAFAVTFSCWARSVGLVEVWSLPPIDARELAVLGAARA
jgi:hypothetical protein